MKIRNRYLQKTASKLFCLALMVIGAIIVLQSFPLDCVLAEEASNEEIQEVASLASTEGVDPFLPFIKRVPDKPKIAKIKQTTHKDTAEEQVFVPPLQRYDVKEFRLRGVASGTSKKVAVVEDGAGKLYTLYQGTAIGLLGGRVVAIFHDKLIVEQKEMDSSGKEISKQITLRLERDKDRGTL